MITIEHNKDEIKFHLDESGIKELIRQLQLLNLSKQDHIHLSSAVYGSDDLSTNPIESKWKTINKLTVYKW